jgi:tetratricopeptide (TPR) repeat protein
LENPKDDRRFTLAGLSEPAIEYWGKAGDLALRRSAFKEAIAHPGKAIEMTEAASPGQPRDAAATGTASQRLKLQTSYGQAVMWSKGFVAGETKAAFARVGELATEMIAAEAPLDAFFARWGHNLWRTRVGQGDVREPPARSGTLGAADGGRGRASLSRNDAPPPRRFRAGEGAFGTDATNLRPRARPRSQVPPRCGRQSRGDLFSGLRRLVLGRCRTRKGSIDEAVARAVESAHAPTLANTYFSQAEFEILRDNADAARRAAEACVALSREHGLALYLCFGSLASAWARAKLGDRDAGSTEFRQALAEYAGQGNKLSLPFYRGLLAEIEAERGDPEAALAGIDETLSLAGETGEHWFDVELHRIRGEILIRQNPADPAPAEAAFLAAITVAQQQKARSFELRAALSLAKLYRARS